MAYRQRHQEEYDDLDEFEEKRKRKLKNDELAPDDEVDLASLAAEDLEASREAGYRRRAIMTREELRGRLAEARLDRPAVRSEASKIARAVIGAGLVAAGLTFLLSQTGLNLPLLDNWWAFFILAPGGLMLYRAYADWQARGRFSEEGKKALTGGAFTTLTGLLALFSAWNLWPLYLVLAGVFGVLGIRGDGGQHNDS